MHLTVMVTRITFTTPAATGADHEAGKLAEI
jgi:hypothetical protein